MSYNSVADKLDNLHSFSRCWLPKSRITRNCDKIWPYSSSSHPRSSILVSIESAYVTSY